MDISKLNTAKAAEKGNTLHLLHPGSREKLFHDSGAPITITGYGADSKTYKKIQADIQRKNTNNRNEDLSREDIDNLVIEQLASVLTNWTGIEDKGEMIPLTIDNATMLFECWPWAKEQWAEFVNDRANFLPDA